MKRNVLLLMFLWLLGYAGFGQVIFTEDFENGGNFPSGWTLVPGTGDDWQIDQGDEHGPGAAHGGSYCAYFDDYWYSSGTEAQMITPRIDLSFTNPGDIIVLSYWYWDGGGSDKVEVLASTDGTNFTPIDTTETTVDPWAAQIVDLSAFAGEDTLYISFKGVSIYGLSNPHVDDIMVKRLLSNDLAAIAVSGPSSYCGMTIDTIRMSIVNIGISPQSSYSVSYSIDGGATWSPSENINTTLNPGDTLNYAFTTLADFSAPGIYDIMAVVNLSGDEDNTNDTVIGNPIISQPVITSYPYSQDFEGTQYWQSGGSSSNTWELGQPNGATINTAASGANAWYTNGYQNSENAYVESPCFDFTNLNAPILKFDLFINSESGYDGVHVEYTVDNGATWQVLGAVGDWYNWYDDSYVAGTPGWSHGPTDWATVKHEIFALAGQPHVKFRIYFKADGSVVGGDGAAFDNFEIYDAPNTLALTEISYNPPEGGTDSLEYLEFYNYGQDPVNLAGMYFLGNHPVQDTFPAQTLFPGELFVTAGNSAAMANTFGYTGVHTWISGGMSNGGEQILLVAPGGDTIVNITYDDNAPWPTDPDGHGPSLVFCPNMLLEGADPADGANWRVSSVVAGTNTDGDVIYGSPGFTDDACTDIAIVEPEYGNGHHYYDCDIDSVITVMVANIGGVVIPSGDTLLGGYQINNGTWVYDTLVLTSDFAAGDTIPFVFTQTYDFSALGDYNFVVYVNYAGDNNAINDTSAGILTHYEPVVDLGPDTLYTTQPDTVVLDAGAGFDTYLWNDGSTGQTLQVTCADTCTYYVATTDSNGCSASDTIVVIKLHYYDIALVEPEYGSGHHYYDCDLNDTIDIEIMNTADTIPAGEIIYASYQINGGSVVNESLVLTNDFATGDTISFVFSQTYDFSALGDYNFVVYVNYAGDTIAMNDTSAGILTHYEPVVDLGPDTLYTTQPDTVVLDAGAGFDSYLWNDGSTGQTLQVNDYGTYYVTVQDSNGCIASDTIVIEEFVLSDYVAINEVSVYPNPTGGIFNVRVPSVMVGNTNLYVMDITGKVIRKVIVDNTTTKVDLSGYSKGIYFVKLVNGTTTKVIKVIVK